MAWLKIVYRQRALKEEEKIKLAIIFTYADEHGSRNYYSRCLLFHKLSRTAVNSLLKQ